MSKEPILLTASQEAVLLAMSGRRALDLMSVCEVVLVCKRSENIVRRAIRFLIKKKLVEKPMGQRCGARLTLNGQVVAYDILESRSAQSM